MVSSLKNWLKSIINEEINKGQLISVSTAISVPYEELKKWVEETDPTPNKSYAVWILRGLKRQNIRIEDKQRIQAALNRFIQLRNANQIEDIMQFPDLHALETRLQDLIGVGSRRQGFAGVNPSTLPGVEIIEDRPKEDIVFYKVKNPLSLAKMGEGTKWCTRTSYQGNANTAQSYINRYGYIIVGYKGGKPFVQYNPDFSQVMDVNDAGMHGPEAKTLELPKPNVKIAPIHKWTISRDIQSPEKILKKWSQYTTQPLDLSKELPQGSRVQRDEKFEKRLANAIAKSDSYFYHLKLGMALDRYSSILNGQRVPEIENAILNKDWTKTLEYKSSSQGKHSNIPIIEGIASYVKNAIRENWPEFERKYLNDDPYNALVYFYKTGLQPDYIENTVTKDVIIFSKYLKDKDPSSTDYFVEFEAALKDFYFKARSMFKHSKFTTILHNVLIPYVKKSHRSVTEILGPEASRVIFKNVSMLSQFVKIEQNRDPILERLLLTKINNVFKSKKTWHYRDNFLYIFDYCKNVLKGPWPEYEKLVVHYIQTYYIQTYGKIVGTDHTLLRYFAEYAVRIRKDNWEELRNVLGEKDRELYDKFVGIERNG